MLLSNYEARTRVKSDLRPSRGRFNATLFGFTTVYDYSSCDEVRNRYGVGSYQYYLCKKAVKPKEVPTSFNPGYILNHTPSYEVSSIQDWVGKYVWTTITKTYPYYEYPTKLCRYYNRMGDPRASKCRIRRLREVVLTVKRRYRPPNKAVFDLKPVDHFKMKLWKETGGIDFVENHNAIHNISDTPSVAYPTGGTIPIADFTRFPMSTYEYFGQWSKRRLPLASLQVVDIYRKIAVNLDKIGGFTLETEANLVVDLLQIQQLIAIFSVASYTGGPLIKLASAFLAYEFGIKPTYDDILSVMDLDTKCRIAVDRWNKKAGKPQYFHFRTSEEVKDLIPYTGTYYTQRVVTREHMNATLVIVGTHLEYPSFSDRLRQFGADKPLSAVWEMIPFSFIVDWFTDISGYISAFETKASPAKFRVIDACYSHTFKGVASTYPTSNVYSYMKGEGVVHQEFSSYKRSYLNVDYLNSPNFRGEQGGWQPSSRFGTKQAFLSGALFLVLNPAFRR